MSYTTTGYYFLNLENMEDRVSEAGYEDAREPVEEVLSEMVSEFESWEAAKSIVRRIRNCKSEEEYDLINNVFIDIFGWSLDTFKERVECKINGEKCEYY